MSSLEDKIIHVMAMHVAHTVIVSGYHEREVTRSSIAPGNATVNYAGFPVHCKTCDRSLSQQWS